MNNGKLSFVTMLISTDYLDENKYLYCFRSQMRIFSVNEIK